MEEKRQNYTVEELLTQLRQDSSWEPEAEYRKKAIGMLLQNILPNA